MHARFNRFHVFWRERLVAEHVVVKTIFNHRTDDHLHIWVQLFDRMAHQMRARVADDFHAFLVFGSNDV